MIGFWAVFWLRERSSPLEPDHSAHVVDEVSHADLGVGARHADGLDEQAYTGFLSAEHVLYFGPDSEARRVGPGPRFG